MSCNQLPASLDAKLINRILKKSFLLAPRERLWRQYAVVIKSFYSHNVVIFKLCRSPYVVLLMSLCSHYLKSSWSHLRNYSFLFVYGCFNSTSMNRNPEIIVLNFIHQGLTDITLRLKNERRKKRQAVKKINKRHLKSHFNAKKLQNAKNW